MNGCFYSVHLSRRSSFILDSGHPLPVAQIENVIVVSAFILTLFKQVQQPTKANLEDAIK